MSLDWQAIGTALGAVGMVAGGIWAWWLKNQRSQANTRAEVAEAGAERAVADAQQTVYKLLTQRVETLEQEMRAVRAELDAERKHSRRLEMHIWRLERLMRNAGIEPPPFPDDEPVRAGGTE